MNSSDSKIPEKCQQCGLACYNKIDILQGLSVDKQNLILNHAKHQHAKKGTVLFTQGESAEAIYLIHSGSVKLGVIDSEGREQIVGIFADGDTIWEGVLMADRHYTYTGECMTDVDYCRITRRDFEKVLTDPVIALNVIGLLSQKLHDANDRNLILSKNDPTARVAGFLLGRSQHTGDDAVNMKLGDIAASVCLRPETVSRKLKKLADDGIISKIGQSRWHIDNFEALKELFEN